MESRYLPIFLQSTAGTLVISIGRYSRRRHRDRNSKWLLLASTVQFTRIERVWCFWRWQRESFTIFPTFPTVTKELLNTSSNETQDKEFLMGTLWILFLWWLERYAVGTSLWQKILLTLFKLLSVAASPVRAGTGLLLTLPYPARPLPCPARLVTIWLWEPAMWNRACHQQSLSLICGLAAKDLKVGAQAVCGGCMAMNSSMTDSYWLLEKSSLEGWEEMLCIKI